MANHEDTSKGPVHVVYTGELQCCSVDWRSSNSTSQRNLHIEHSVSERRTWRSSKNSHSVGGKGVYVKTFSRYPKS